MSDNPFAEPDDADRTVIRPMPGGGRAAARPAARPVAAAPPPAPPPPAAPPPAAAGADLAAIATAQANPLAAAASPLLQLLARLRNTATPPDQGSMRDRTLREMRAFEKRARDAGVPMEQLRPAHFILCASLDDVVLNTPWGAHGPWQAATLTSTLHREARGADGFFEHLRQMRQDPAAYLPVIELIYLCLSLGFMGPYRAVPDGQARIDRVREQTYDLIAKQRGKAQPELAPHTSGVVAPQRVARARFPVWVALCAVLAVLAGGFVLVLTGLNGGSDTLYARMAAAPPASMPHIVRAPLVQPPPPPPEPPPPGPADRLRAALASDIAAKAVSVAATPSSTLLRIPARSLFAPAGATLLPAAGPLLDRIGAALKGEHGPLRILAYTDNQPVHTVQFPSLFALSTARAQAVRTGLARGVGDAGRLAAEGRADADPLAPNATPDGRETNRHVDIVLRQE